MIRFGVIVSIVAVAFGLLVAGAVSGTLALVYASIAVVGLALLLLVAGVVIWREEVFGRSAAVSPASLGRDDEVAVAAGAGTAHVKDAHPAKADGDRRPAKRAASHPAERSALQAEAAGSGTVRSHRITPPPVGSGSAGPPRISPRPVEPKPAGRRESARPAAALAAERPAVPADGDQARMARHGAGRGDDALTRPADEGGRGRRQRKETPTAPDNGPARGPAQGPAVQRSRAPASAAPAAPRSSAPAASAPEALRSSAPSAPESSAAPEAGPSSAPPGPAPAAPRKPAPSTSPASEAPTPDRERAKPPAQAASAAAKPAPLAAKSAPATAKPAPAAAPEASPSPASTPAATGNGSDSHQPKDSQAPENNRVPLDTTVTVVPGITRYHRADCILIRFLGAEDLETMTIERAEESDCVPCRACRPEVAPVRA